VLINEFPQEWPHQEVILERPDGPRLPRMTCIHAGCREFSGPAVEDRAEPVFGALAERLPLADARECEPNAGKLMTRSSGGVGAELLAFEMRQYA